MQTLRTATIKDMLTQAQHGAIRLAKNGATFSTSQHSANRFYVTEGQDTEVTDLHARICTCAFYNANFEGRTFEARCCPHINFMEAEVAEMKRIERMEEEYEERLDAINLMVANERASGS